MKAYKSRLQNVYEDQIVADMQKQFGYKNVHMMYDFIDRFVNIALPRVKDFRGLSSKTFDGNGNYAIGLKEQIIFPEINYDKVDKIRGMDIVFVTNAKTDEEARALLKMFNFPINNN